MIAPNYTNVQLKQANKTDNRTVSYKAKYSGMDQAKFVQGNL